MIPDNDGFPDRAAKDDLDREPSPPITIDKRHNPNECRGSIQKAVDGDGLAIGSLGERWAGRLRSGLCS